MPVVNVNHQVIAQHLLRGIENLVVPAVSKTAVARSTTKLFAAAAFAFVQSYWVLEAITALYVIRRVLSEVKAARSYRQALALVPA